MLCLIRFLLWWKPEWVEYDGAQGLENYISQKQGLLKVLVELPIQFEKLVFYSELDRKISKTTSTLPWTYAMQ